MCRTPPLHEPPPQGATTNCGAEQNHMIKPSNYDLKNHNNKISNCSAAGAEDLHSCSAKIMMLPSSPADTGKKDLKNMAEYSAVSKEEIRDDIEIGLPRSKIAISDQILHCPTFQEVMEELWKLMANAVPLVIAGLMLYPRGMISMYFLGRMGKLELAGGALAIAFANITGYSVLYGLALGMEPICGQAYGARQHGLMVRTTRMAMLGLAMAALPIAGLWLSMGPILVACGQHPEVTATASVYLLYSLPDLAAQCVLHPLRIYLRSQNVTVPLSCCAALSLPLHLAANVVAVRVLRLGVRGVALASVSTNVNMLLLLLAYLKLSKRPILMGVSTSSSTHHHHHPSVGLGSGLDGLGLGLDPHDQPDPIGHPRPAPANARDWLPLLKLAVPSCVSVCLEWWWYELMILLSGLLSDPEASVATMGILIQITALVYIFPSSLSLAVSTRVSNELGANRPGKARLAVIVASCCAVVLGVFSMGFTTAIRHAWGHMFTDDKTILRLTSMALPIIGLCELGNSPQTTGCGVLRGSARPSVGVKINLAAFYIVGLPVSVALVFWFRVGFVGLWLGLLAAQATCAVSMMLVMMRTNWLLEADRSRELTKKASSTTPMAPMAIATTTMTRGGPTPSPDNEYEVKAKPLDQQMGDDETLALLISHSFQ